MGIEELKKLKEALLDDKSFMETIYKFVKVREKEDFIKEIEKSLADSTTNDNEN